MEHIRKAVPEDASRIAEILVFAKRCHYRDIFRNDEFSFNVLQVLPIAQGFARDKSLLEGVFVFDDGILRGMIRINGPEVCELYVDPFFQGNGIGRALLEFAVSQMNADFLWVLEKNSRAIGFYEKMGFFLTGDRKNEPGTNEFIALMKRK